MSHFGLVMLLLLLHFHTNELLVENPRCRISDLMSSQPLSHRRRAKTKVSMPRACLRFAFCPLRTARLYAMVRLIEREKDRPVLQSCLFDVALPVLLLPIFLLTIDVGLTLQRHKNADFTSFVRPVYQIGTCWEWCSLYRPANRRCQPPILCAACRSRCCRHRRLVHSRSFGKHSSPSDCRTYL